MDMSELFRRFELAISYYNIPVGMYNHGRSILEDLLNLTECTTNRLVLNQYTGWHVMERPYQCVRMVYVLVKGKGVSFDPSTSTIRIPLDAKVYAGQTVNFRNREYARLEPMRDANVKLCLAHNLSTYQMDSLETVMILYCFFVFGLRTTNGTIYPVNIYRNIPTTMLWNDVNRQNSLDRVNTWNWSGRVLMIGTAPPATLLNDASYVQALERHTNPHMDWTSEMRRSRNIRFLAHLLREGSQPLPTCINHYPRTLSDSYRGLLGTTSFDDIWEADTNVRRCIAHLQRDVMVMVGRRPTLLYPQDHRSYYFTTVCPYMDIYWLTPNTCGFVLWWIDPGLRRHTNESNSLLIEHILQLSAILLKILLWKIYVVSGETIGIPQNTAAQLQQWLADQPISLQLYDLLKKLSESWTEPQGSMHASDHPFLIDAIYDHSPPSRDRSRNPVEEGLLSRNIQQRLPNTSISEVARQWSDNYKSKVVNETVHRVPTFHALDDESKAQEIQRTCQIHGAVFARNYLNTCIASGRFVPMEGEDVHDQWARCWKQINFEKMNRSSHPRSAWLTCCWCGKRHLRVLSNTNSIVDPSSPLWCPAGSHLTTGWELIDKEYSGAFPENNVFFLFYESLRPGIVINQKQPAAALMSFLDDNRWHPQAEILYNRYFAAQGLIMTFESNEAQKALISTFVAATKRSMKRLTALPTPAIIQTTKRYSLVEELSGRINVSANQTLFGIKTCLENERSLVSLEDLDFLGYRQHFRVETRGVWYEG